MAGLSSGAYAQANQPAQAQAAAGGTVSGGGVNHITSTGIGMAVGRSAAGNVVSYEGYLARAVAARDVIPPVFDPAPVNIRMVIPANAVACSATVAIPAARAVDNRDPNPVVTVTLNTVPPQAINPAGQNVVLARGSYDVVEVATDRRGNSSQATYRIDVVDATAPTFVSTPNPTPVGSEAEATSPAGTPVVLAAATCSDVCDAHPVVASNVPARFPLGDTTVTYTCTDASGNASQSNATVRVRDRTAPVVAGAAPGAFSAPCNDPAGSTVRVPGIVWQDNGWNANALVYSLIVDPAGANQAFSPVPANVVLSGGAHVLRYVAQDGSGNRGTYNLNVTVDDNSSPTIQVVNAPALGWYNADAQVNLRITDNCSALGNNLQVNVVPAPVGQSINNGVLTLQYHADGVYSLSVTVTDTAGNSAVDNSIGFGIDRTLPNTSVVIPSQSGVTAGQTYTYPVYAYAETMPLNVAGDDPGDGLVSGVRQIQVLLDPDAQGRPRRILVDRTFAGNGAPPRGSRTQNNIRCTDNVAGDAAAVCNANGEVNMRKIPIGAHMLRTVVTDFAGNASQSDAKVYNATLRDGLDTVQRRIQVRMTPAGGAALAAPITNLLNLALPKLSRGYQVTDIVVPESAYSTPMFLGSALKGVQDATINLTDALAQAAAADAPTFRSWIQVLDRTARSDLTLFKQDILEANVVGAIMNDAQLSQWLLPEYTLDMGNADSWLADMDASIAGERYTNAAADSVEAFFSLKSAWSGWMMNYHFNPGLDFHPEEFARGASILGEIQDELAAYNANPAAPGRAKTQDMAVRLGRVTTDLTSLALHGFDVVGGLSDQQYLLDMIEVQNIANSSMVANQQGVWVRNYQWSLMQVVRFMAQSSTALAQLRKGGVAANWQLFQFAQSRINSGVADLENRQVQDAITLYGDAASTCSMIAVYHCYFVGDEGAADTDQVYVAAPSQPCWQQNLALQPNANVPTPQAWSAYPARLIPAECRWGTDI